MDVNGLPLEYANKNGIDIRNNIGSPIAIRSYVKAYHYCMDRFNLKPQVFVHGGSMGGISSTNLVLSGMIPVIAHSAFCPVLDNISKTETLHFRYTLYEDFYSCRQNGFSLPLPEYTGAARN